MARAAQTMNEADMERVTQNTKELLDAQPKVKVKLYLSPEDKKKVEAAKASGKNAEIPFETVSINGYTYQIMRGESVDVPQSVAEVLEQAGLI